MKTKEFITKIFETKKRIIAFSISLAVILLCIFCLATYNHTPKVDTIFLTNQLIDASELTTAKLKMTNMTEYKDEGIKILNRSDFIMVYDATVWAGIDMNEVKISANDLTKVIQVNIPKATILDAKVDSSTIKYFDEKCNHFCFMKILTEYLQDRGLFGIICPIFCESVHKEQLWPNRNTAWRALFAQKAS